MNQHNFIRKEIPYGDKGVIEYCENCGCKSRRYNSQRVYFNKSGGFTGKAPECIKKEITEKIAYSSTSIKLNNLTPKLTQTEASLKDALMIIKLMYDDMIKASVLTNSTRIAGSFLQSGTFTELCTELELKSN